MNNINTLATFATASALSASAFAGEVAPMATPDTNLTLPGIAKDVTMYGYIDIAATHTDGDGDADSTGQDTFDLSVPEVEIGFAFNPENSPWSAVAELSFKDVADTGDSDTEEDTANDLEFETVIVSYAFNDALSFSVGNILSYQGFETYDATGLYQFSYAGAGGDPLYSAAYATGMSLDYVTDDYGFGVWAGESDKGESLSLELLAQYTGYEGLTAKFIYASDPIYDTINPWVSYEIGNLTLAGEYVNTDSDVDGKTSAYLAMINYAFGDAGLTLRYSSGDFQDSDFDRYTISPGYAFSDNVFALLEYSYEEVEGVKDTLLAAEVLFTF